LLRVIGIGGYKKSGKTILIEKLIRELKKRKYEVGTIKHIPKKGFTLDDAKTDTGRYAKAGSKTIIAISPEEIVTIKKEKIDMEKDKAGQYPTLSKILLGLRDLDFVILEGFKEAENLAKIMIARNNTEAKELDDIFTIGFIGEGIKGKPLFGKEEIGAITDLIEKRAIPPVAGINDGDCGHGTCRGFAVSAIHGKAPKDGCVSLFSRVTLTVDGKKVPLKLFLQDLVANILKGVVSSLKGGKGEEIVIKMNKHEK